VTLSDFPVHYKTQTTSVAMAQPEMGTEGNACTSSTEAEIYGASNAVQHIMHVSYVCEELGHQFPKPFTLLMDNGAAEIFCKNTASFTRLKHIDQRQRWVAEIRNSNIMVPQHINTKCNLADMFTKGLSGSLFQNMRGKLLTELWLSAILMCILQDDEETHSEVLDDSSR